MTDAERIAHLEAELEREREEKVRLLAIVEALTAPKHRSTGAERQARYRARHAHTVTSSVTSDVTVTRNIPPTPPLNGSPLSSTPSLPSPLSSPHPLFLSAPPEASPQPATETLALAIGILPAPEEAAKKSPKPKKPPTAVAEFGEWCVAERAKAVPATAVDDTKLRPDQWARLGEAHRDYGRKLLEAAFLSFLAAPYPRSRDCPLGLFVGQLEKWLTEARAGDTRKHSTNSDVGNGETNTGPCVTECGRPSKCNLWGQSLCLPCAAQANNEVSNFSRESIAAWVAERSPHEV